MIRRGASDSASADRSSRWPGDRLEEPRHAVRRQPRDRDRCGASAQLL